ncbi:MAG: AAA family ATPase [Tannerella sp.]|jgi:CYTH domain-containing protein/predicted ATPase|nr:AAA family ATPase [Tannerella sp.]
MQNNITKIVLTGGPCAGKTTALSKIIDRFSDMGYQVYALPESATLFYQAGVNLRTGNSEYFYAAEKALLLFQMQMEERFEEMAVKAGKPAILICDRGLMDMSAYMSDDIWQALLDEMNMSEVQARDKRYDAVLHLVTAAKGAELFYSSANNAARTESLEQAAALDDRLIRAWTGHPHLRVIDNGDSFDTKINRVLAEVAAVLGVPEPVETERKYRVELPAGNFSDDSVENEIFQTYLLAGDGEEVRIRKRGHNGHYIYFLTVKKALSGNSRIETEKRIPPSEYIRLLQHADPERITVHKRRRCFVWQNQYFELDTFVNPALPFAILEIEGAANHEDVIFPPFIKVLEDVTENEMFYNNNLAKKQV